MNERYILAFVGALLIILAGIPYMVDVVRKKTRPNIVFWFTWLLLIVIGAFAALDAHEVNTAIITFGYAKLSLFDGICQAGALGGLVLWLVFDSPTTAIIATVTIDLIAALPTYRHSWLLPGEETWQTYLIGGIGAAVGLASLTSFTAASLAYPVYLFLLGLTLSTTIIVSRKKKGIALFR